MKWSVGRQKLNEKSTRNEGRNEWRVERSGVEQVSGRLGRTRKGEKERKDKRARRERKKWRTTTTVIKKTKKRL